MIKLFFITFFIAELIVAIAVVLKILQFDRCVISWNLHSLFEEQCADDRIILIEQSEKDSSTAVSKL